MGSGGVIGVFDSGVGGLTVWREIVRQLPHEDTLYLADQAHVPYGPRPLAQVREFAEGIARFLLDQGARVIVVACNTASAAALHDLRRTFPDIPFVGMEPAVKPAAERTHNGIVGVIATQATFQGQLFASLVERYADHVRVLTQACPGLVEAVEAGRLEPPDTEALLRQYLAPLLEAGVDQLVLGCTHYPFLRPTIERLVGAGVAVIDPAPAVARQVERVLAHGKPPLKRGVRTDWESEAGQGRVLAHGKPPPKRGVRTTGQYVFYTSGGVGKFEQVLGRLVPFVEANPHVYAARWRDGQLISHPGEGCERP
jgi:glutamate racemase